MQTLQKKKILGVKSYGIFMPNQIQSREYSRDGVTGGFSHNLDSDGNWNVFNLNRNGSKLWLNANYNANPQNHWNLGYRMLFRVRNSLHFSSDN